LQDGAADKEARLLQRQNESIGIRAAIDQVVLGADAEMHRNLVVGGDGVADRRGVEIDLAVVGE
jgi:hypothetical protein